MIGAATTSSKPQRPTVAIRNIGEDASRQSRRQSRDTDQRQRDLDAPRADTCGRHRKEERRRSKQRDGEARAARPILLS